MHIFLTGWRGYVGRSVVRAAMEQGHHLGVLVRSTEESEQAIRAGLRPIIGALDDLNFVRETTRSADAVIHCAASDDPGYQSTNAVVVRAIIENLGTDKTFVMHGGSMVFGATGLTPNSQLKINAPPFLAARAEIDKLLIEASKGGQRTVGVYGSFIYGGGRGAAIPTTWASASRSLGAVAIPGEGSASWSSCHVDDWGRLILLAALRTEAGRGPYFAAAQARSVLNYGRDLGHALGLDVQFVAPENANLAGQFGAALLINQVFSGMSARSELGWQPVFENSAVNILEAS